MRQAAEGEGVAMAQGKLGAAYVSVGFGCLLSYYFSGPVCTSLLMGTMHEWRAALAWLALALLATGLGCLAVRRAWQCGAGVSSPWLGRVSYIFSIFSVIGVYLLSKIGFDPLGMLFCSVVMGISISAPLLFWFDVLLVIFKQTGRTRCIESLVAAELISAGTCLFSWRLGGASSVIACIAAIVIAALCEERLSHSHPPFSADESASGGCSSKGGSYSLTPFTLSTVAGFGTTWGTLNAMSVCLSSTMHDTMSALASSSLGMALSVIGSLVLVIKQRSRGVPYGLLIRVLVAISGSVLVLVPLIYDLSPVLLCVITPVVPLLEGVAMALLSIEISRETGRGIIDVMPVNYIVYTICGCGISLLFILLTVTLGTDLAWRIIAAIATVFALGIVPFLPSGSSSAAVFALNKLPENEGVEDHTRRTCDELSAKFELTSREREVLLRLLQGKSRQEITDSLGLSAWTVKDYTSEVYSKVGVHSRSELMTLLAGGISGSGKS